MPKTLSLIHSLTHVISMYIWRCFFQLKTKKTKIKSRSNRQFFTLKISNRFFSLLFSSLLWKSPPICMRWNRQKPFIPINTKYSFNSTYSVHSVYHLSFTRFNKPCTWVNGIGAIKMAVLIFVTFATIRFGFASSFFCNDFVWFRAVSNCSIVYIEEKKQKRKKTFTKIERAHRRLLCANAMDSIWFLTKLNSFTWMQ